MKKIPLDIIGLTYSATQTGAYALVLGERNGKRRLPIIIGGFEAQSIAVEMENMVPKRPLTHDLFKSFSEVFKVEVNEVIVYNLIEGIFYAKLVCEDSGGEVHEVDARTSDAIAIAVRFKCPISTYDFILDQAGIIMDENTPITDELVEKEAELSELEEKPKDLRSMELDELKEVMKKAIEDEAYERASVIRDEINKRKQSPQ